MRNTKAKAAALLLAGMLLAACNGSKQAAGTASPSVPASAPNVTKTPSSTAAMEMNHSETEIGFMMQEYGDSDTVEVLMVKYDGSQPLLEEYGGKHPEIEMLNNQIEADALKIYHDYQDGNLELDSEPDGIEILSYPLADEDFLQIVSTCYVYPETRPNLYTRVWSYCYSLDEDRIITLDDMLDDYHLSVGDVKAAFERLYEAGDGEEIVDISMSGFFINRAPAKPLTHFLLEVMIETESDPYKCLFIYTPDNDEVEELDIAQLLNPDYYELLEMDPPLKYGQGSGAGNNGLAPAPSSTGNGNTTDDEITPTVGTPTEEVNEEAVIPTDGSINGEDMAMDLMNSTLGKGQVAVFSEDGEVDGEHVWVFEVGTELDGLFMPEARYAVTHDGRVIKL